MYALYYRTEKIIVVKIRPVLLTRNKQPVRSMSMQKQGTYTINPLFCVVLIVYRNHNIAKTLTFKVIFQYITKSTVRILIVL